MNSLLENMISTKEASEFSGYNSDYLGRLCRSNKIIGTQVGRTWLISKDSLELFMKEQAAHKEDLHASLKATREKEYQYHIQKKQDTATHQDTSVLSPLSYTSSPEYLEKLTEKANSSAFKNKGIAVIAAMGVLLCGIYGAQAAQSASFSKDAASAVLGISSAVRGVYSPSPVNAASVVLSPNVIPDTFAQLVSPGMAPIAFSVSNPITIRSAPENPTDVAYASSKVSFLETRPIVFLAENVASYEVGAVRSPRAAAIALAALEVHTYIGTGAALYESITNGLNAYVQGITLSGAETLALGTAIQSSDEEFPRALASSEIQLPQAWSSLSQDILQGYSKGVYAWVDETPVLPVTILGVEYAIGTKIANATVVVPEALAEGYPSSNYLAAAAVPDNYTLGQSVAIATYTTLHNLFGGIAQQVALIFNPSAASSHTTLQIFPTYVVTANSATTTPIHTSTNTTSVAATPAGTASNSVNYSSEPSTRTVVEQNVVQGVTQSYVDGAINNLHDFLIKQIEAATRVENDGGSSNGGSTIIVVSTSSPTGAITGTSLNVSGDTALTGNLSAATTTLNGPVTINGDVTINGNLIGGNIPGGANGTNVGPNFIATSTTATSTFYGSVNIDNGGLSYSTTTRTTTIANAVVANATSTNLFSANSNFTNASSTNFFAGLLQSTNGMFVSLVAQLGNFTNLFATNATTTNATSTNLYATNGIFGNLLATIANFTSALIVNLTATNAVFTNATSTNATSTNFFATNALFTSATTTNFGVTNLTTTNFTSATGSLGSLAVAGNSSLANFSFLNATGTSLNLATLTATGNATVGGLSVGNLNGFLKATAGAISTSLISLTSDVSNILPVQNGGTGTSSFSTNGVVYGSGTANLLTTAQGGSNSVLVANNGAPAFSSSITVGTSVTSPTIDATGSIQLNGADINSAGTLSNVSYTNQPNSYTRPQSFTDYSGVDSTTTNATTTNLSTTNLSISNYFSIGSLSGILKAVNGAVTTAIAGTDYQLPGNYLTGLTGDITASGPGSAIATLATVNANTGSFGAASTIPTFTVNAKGLITGVSTTTVVAPAGTLTGNALASNVLSSSLTSLGTLANLTVSGTSTIGNIVNNGLAANTLIYANGINQESSASVSAPLSFTNGTLSLGTVGIANGGTGITSYTGGSLLYANTFGVLTQLPIGTNGQVLEIAGGVPGWGSGISGGGGSGGGIFATSSNIIYPINTSNTLIIGSNAQSDVNSLFEVHGTSYFSGYIGIGTTTPNVLLDVAGSNEVAAFGDGNSGATYIGFGASGASNNGAGYIGYNGLSGNTVVQGASGHGIEFDVNNSTFAGGNAMTINSSGQVGIGTTTPGSLLSIQGIANFTAATSTFSSTGGINLNNGCFAINGTCLGNGSGTIAAGVAGQFPYYSGTGTALTPTSSLYMGLNGNIGVGTTSPGTNLAVEGNGLFSGNLNVANLTATGTASLGNATSTSLYTSLIGLGSSYFSSLTGNGLSNLNGVLSISSSSLASGFFQQGGNAFGAAAVLGTTNANPLTFVTNGLEVGRFSASGNFGIKNTNPSYPLDIGSTGLISQFGDTSANDYISVAGGSSYFGYDSLLQNAAIQAPSGEGIEFNVNNSTFSLGTAAVISSAGKFGIGTTTPGSLLSIQGIANFTAATSTFSSTGGINLNNGCYAVNGNCVGLGTVTSVAASGGTTGLTFSGSPITNSGTLTLGGILGVANGGTGSSTPSGVLVGNGLGGINTLTIGSGLTLAGATLSSNAIGVVGAGTSGQFPYYAGTGTTLTATSSLYLATNGNVGVGTTSPSYQLDVNGIARASIYDEGGQVFNVKAYGAKGNGTTNDTVAIQTAINAANAAGGGTVYFPQGTYITGTLTLYSYVHLLGAGEDVTILQLASGTNAAVIQTYGFASLTGTNPVCNVVNACGPTDFSIEELSVNGGRYSGNTSSVGIQIYGAHYDMDNVQVYWAAGDGIYSEWSSYGGSPNTPHGFDAGMEAHITGVYVYGNNGDGVDWKGPHDSLMTNMNFVGSANAGLYVGSNGAGLQVTNAHSWSSQTYAFYLGGTTYLTNIQAEGATTSQIQVNTGNVSIVQATVYACAAGVNGIALGDSTHFPYDTTVTSTRLSDCGINFTYDGGNSDINVTYNAHDGVSNSTGLNTSTGPGTSTSTPPSTDTVEINATNDPGATALGTAVNQTSLSNYASTTASNWLGSNNVQVYNLLSTNTYSGFGEVQGNNISSPVVWMYNPGGMTNAFSVRSVVYGSTLAQSPDLFSVFSNGYVGIGTTTPSAMLSVNGSALFNGGITANSLNIVGGSFALGTTSPSYAGGSNGLAVDGTFATFGVYSSSSGRSITIVPSTGAITSNGTNLNINRYSGNSVTIGNSAATGNLGIGQSNPTGARLQISGGSTGTAIPLMLLSTSTSVSTTTVFEVDQNGNALLGLGGASVGIGTTSPGSLLSIQGIANFTAATSTFSSTGGINLTGGCFSINGTCVGGGAAGGTVGSSALAGQFPYYAGTGTTLTATSSLYISPSGNIGVGTTSPATIFGIDSTATSGTILRISNGSAGGHIYSIASTGSGNTSGTGELDFYDATAGVSRLNINSNGYVGIGTTTPGALFAVGGNALIGGALTATGGLSVNGALNDLSTATSTLAGGTNITSGCYAVNGVCLTAGVTTPWTTSSSSIYYNTGNVGIGTTTPGSLLSIQGIANFTAATSTFSSTGGINLTGGCFSINGTCVGGGAAGGTVGSSALAGQFPYYAGTGTTLTATSSLYLAANGNIGIGTTSPAYTLDVGGNIDFSGNLYKNGVLVSTGGTGSQWTTSGSSIYYTGGNVGIGTTSPTVAGGSNGLAIDGTFATFGVYSSSSGRSIILSPGGGSLDAVGSNLNINRYSGNSVTIGNSAATGNLGIGQSNPTGARLQISGGSTGTAIPLMLLSTSTSVSTTTVFEVDQNGNALLGLGGASVGIGTTSPGSLLSIQGIANFTAATSTFSSTGGINLTGGCFSINGTCVGGGAAGGTVGSSALAGQFPYYAGTGTTLTATSSLYLAANGNVGVGTTTPLSALAVSGGESIGSGYNIAAPTNGLIVQGNVGIGTTSPASAGLTVDGTFATLGVYSSSNDRAIILAPSGGNIDAVGSNLNINRFSGNSVSIGLSASSGNLSIGQVASNLARFYVAGTANGPLPLEIFSTSTPTSTTTVAEIDQNGNALLGLGGGRVGIGTTTPAVSLDIVGTENIEGAGDLLNIGPYASAGGTAFVTTAGRMDFGYDGVNGNAAIQAVGGKGIELNVNNATFGSGIAAVISAAGNFGVGTTSPLARLDIAGANGGTTPLLQVSSVSGYATTTRLIVSNAGLVGIGTTSPISTLTVVGSGCFSVGAGATATCGTTPGNIYYTNSNTGNYDVAEDYVTTNSSITPGTIVSVDPNNAEYITTAVSGSTVLGVVSTAPGVTLGGADGSTKGMITKPVALSGRIPVQVNLDGGPIQIGDRIALSSTPGVGQKAVSSGETVGIALQSAYAPGTIQVFVQPQYMFSAGDLSFDGQGNVSIGAAAASVPSTTGTTYKLTVNGSESAAGTVSASSFTVAGAGAAFAQNFSSLSFGSTTALSVLTNGGQDVDIYKLATFTLSNLQTLTTQTNTISSQIQSLTARVTALEAGANAGMQAAEASSTSSSFFAASSTQLASALESFGVVLQNGIAQFNTLVTSDLSFSKSADGSSAAGSSSILAGNTTVVVQNSHMFSTSQVSVTMTSAYAGNWYVSQKQNGSFQVTLSQTQPANVTFDYFIVQTQGQIATSTPTGYVGSPFSWIATLFGGTTTQTPVAAPAPTSNSNASTSTITGSGATTSSSTPSASAPIVTLTGAAAISLNVNDAFIDPGATAKDVSGNDISSSIVETGSVNTATAGIYTLTYTATDAAGNTGSVSRVVTVSGAPANSSVSSSTSSASSAPATTATTPATDATPVPSTSSTSVAPVTPATAPTTPATPVTTASPATASTAPVTPAAAPASAASPAAPASGDSSSAPAAAAASPSS